MSQLDERAPVDPFAPPADVGEWTPVSPRLATVRRLVLAGFGVPVAVLAAAGAALFASADQPAGVWILGAVAALVAIGVVVGLWLTGRVVRSWGYAVGEDLLYIRRGRFFRELTAVPHARLQFVDITAGPLARTFGLATLQLHTASAATDAAIPGLPAPRAAELRDRLTALSEGRYAGL